MKVIISSYLNCFRFFPLPIISEDYRIYVDLCLTRRAFSGGLDSHDGELGGWRRHRWLLHGAQGKHNKAPRRCQWQIFRTQNNVLRSFVISLRKNRPRTSLLIYGKHGKNKDWCSTRGSPRGQPPWGTCRQSVQQPGIDLVIAPPPSARISCR